MYFFAFPLLLVVSTICASPVRIENRGSNLVPQNRCDGDWPYHYWHSKKTMIPQWSHPDVVFEPSDADSVIVKRVDMTVTHGQTTVNHDIAKQLMVTEVWNLEIAHQLVDWQMKPEVSESGEHKVYSYILMKKMGVPASEHQNLKPEELDALRERGIKEYEKMYKIVLAPEYNQDRYFAFPPVIEKDSYAHPIFWRHARHV